MQNDSTAQPMSSPKIFSQVQLAATLSVVEVSVVEVSVVEVPVVKASGKDFQTKKLKEKNSIEPGPATKASLAGWKRTGALTGVAVASAGVMLPMASEQAIAYDSQFGSSAVQQKAASRSAAQGQNLDSALQPQTSQRSQASFSAGSRSKAQPRAGTTRNTALEVAAPLLSRAEDGSLMLAYQSPEQVSRGQAQTVLSDLVGATNQASQAVQTDSQTQRAAGTAKQNSNLAAARQQVQQLQQRLSEFEAARGQQDMAAYQNVLASRMSEVAEQKTRLEANIERNQRVLTQLKMRMLTVDADLALPAQVLAADTEYQAVWARLQKAEQNLADEFSQADVNATRLNEIYADYKYHQQWLARAAEQAFPSYMMDENAETPRFVGDAPAAIDVMQNLVVATHEEQVQALRQDTISTIEQRLAGRHTQLLTDIGQYEQIERELATAQQLVSQYEQSGDGMGQGQLVADSSEQPATQTTSAVKQAQMLAPYFPNGTMSKVLLGIVVSAGAIATAVIHHRGNRSSDLKGNYSEESVDNLLIGPAAPDANFAAFSLHGETVSAQTALDDDLFAEILSTIKTDEVAPISTDELLTELLEITGGEAAEDRLGDRVHPIQYPANSADDAPSTSALTRELMDITGRPNNSAAVSKPLTAELVEDILGIEVMAKELEDIIDASVAVLEPAILPSAAPRLSPSMTRGMSRLGNSAAGEPVKLAVRDVDLFAEQVIDWVLADLGLQVVKQPQKVAA